MRLSSLLMFSATIFGAVTVSAAEKVIAEKNQHSLDISIYNQNLALVKDVRQVELERGVNDIAFEGVASSLKPETAILYAEGLQVLEQNYDYDLLSSENIINKSVGQTVKTVIINPSTGQNIYDDAEIVSFSGYGTPILKFNYGIEANFPGRLVFDKLPASLRKKPTLVAKVVSGNTKSQDVSLAYLTNGISWKTDYVAKIVGEKSLNLTGWVTINNESGIDYNNAKVQLIAGNVNQIHEPKYSRGVAMKAMALNDAVAEYGMTEGATQQELSGYHMYTLPRQTTIKDKQTKQISLIEKNGVKYKKEARINSQLYFSPTSQAHFKQVHPDMYYVINNKEEDNLGMQLPSGTIRFYENDDSGNLQFIGENSINHIAKGEKMELRLGSFVNMFADGKIAKTEKLPQETSVPDGDLCQKITAMYNYEAEVKITNSGKNPQEAVYTQNLPQDARIVSDNLNGKLKHSGLYEWRIVVPADGKQILRFTVKAPNIRRVCR